VVGGQGETPGALRFDAPADRHAGIAEALDSRCGGSEFLNTHQESATRRHRLSGLIDGRGVR
jgi:hypothetical protein